MFYIFDGRTHFYQWDYDQKLIVNDASIKEVHFCNRTDDCALVVEVYELDGARVVNVPNVLLQYDWRIRAYAYTGNSTKVEASFTIYPRSKPADYVYTETEVKNYAALEERVKNIEDNGVSQEIIEAAINDYFVKNPIETGATEEQAAQIAENTEAIALLDRDIDNVVKDMEELASKEYVDNLFLSIVDAEGVAY